MTNPRPSPSTSRYSATSQSGVETASRDRRIIARAATAVPMIGNGLYRPVFEITFPLPIDAISTPEHHRRQQQARRRRAPSFHDLHVERQVRDRPEQGDADDEPDPARDRERPILEQRQRQDRLRGTALSKHEEREQHRAEHRQPDRLDRPPRVGRPTEAREEHHRGQASRQQPCPEVVDRVSCAVCTGVEGDRDHRQCEQTDGQVDVEDPMPGEAVDEEPTDQRPDHGGDAEDGAEVPLVAAAVARRHDVADRSSRDHHQPAAAETLQRTERDQRRHVPREPAQRRADQEDNDRRLQHRLAPVEVTELPIQRRHHRRRQQVRGHHPREMLDTAKIANDRRKRCRDDRLIERRQQRDEKQRRENQAHTLLPLYHNRLAQSPDRDRLAHTRRHGRTNIHTTLSRRGRERIGLEASRPGCRRARGPVIRRRYTWKGSLGLCVFAMPRTRDVS